MARQRDAASFRVEEFLESITAQLDRTQDALRLKAVNRPLTYAIRDFDLELKVFVDMDEQGYIRFRTAGPNEEGASVVKIGFTTITRPMVEENTVTLEESGSATLDELGLEPDETRQLEKVGVRNAAQLRRLEQRTGAGAVSRLSGVPVTRLRSAFDRAKPSLSHVGSPKPAPERATPSRDPLAIRPVTPRRPAPPRRTIRLPAHTREVEIAGRNLSTDGPLSVSLDAEALEIVHRDDDRIVARLPAETQGGVLSVALGGEALAYDLEIEAEAAFESAWAPARRARR